MTRDEWKRRYAARLMERGGMAEIPAIESSEEGAVFFEAGIGVRAYGGVMKWEDESPEDAADEEMSYWENDGE